MPKRFTCLDLRLMYASASSGSRACISGRIFVQNSGSSMSTSCPSSAMKAAFEKTEPLLAVASYETLVDDDARISSMLDAENCSKALSSSCDGEEGGEGGGGEGGA